MYVVSAFRRTSRRPAKAGHYVLQGTENRSKRARDHRAATGETYEVPKDISSGRDRSRRLAYRGWRVSADGKAGDADAHSGGRRSARGRAQPGSGHCSPRDGSRGGARVREPRRLLTDVLDDARAIEQRHTALELP